MKIEKNSTKYWNKQTNIATFGECFGFTHRGLRVPKHFVKDGYTHYIINEDFMLECLIEYNKLVRAYNISQTAFGMNILNKHTPEEYIDTESDTFGPRVGKYNGPIREMLDLVQDTWEAKKR